MSFRNYSRWSFHVHLLLPAVAYINNVGRSNLPPLMSAAALAALLVFSKRCTAKQLCKIQQQGSIQPDTILENFASLTVAVMKKGCSLTLFKQAGYLFCFLVLQQLSTADRADLLRDQQLHCP